MARLGKEPRLLVIGAKEYCETITYFLQDKEVVLFTVSQPEKVLEVFNKARPDVVIIDCVTPSTNGFALFRWLRINSGLPPLPCLLITVSQKQHRLHEDEATAPTEFIDTPIRQSELESKLRLLFQQGAVMQNVRGTPVHRPTPPPQPGQREERSTGLALNASAIGKKIMIVEDDQEHSNVLTEFLEREGYQVIQSNNLDSFKVAVLNKPDLIVMDIRMPVLDGFMLAEVFKACRLTRHIPIVFLSALHEAKYAEASKSVQAAAFVTKPVKGSNFLFTIGMVLKQEAPRTG